MSSSRRDLHKAKLRRERIRREKHAANAMPISDPNPFIAQPFTMERTMRDMQSMLDGQEFDSLEDANAHLKELTARGGLAEIASAWNQDDPKWKAQELAYEALEADDGEEALMLAARALQLDPNCIDAQRVMVSAFSNDRPMQIKLMKQVVEDAETNLGPAFFKENAGHFWRTISTRPYMRAVQHLADLLADSGDLTASIPLNERLMELNPDDNQGIRFVLLAQYLATNQQAGAERLLTAFSAEERLLGSMAWARVLYHWLTGEFSLAEGALARARKVNPFVEPYITGANPIPRETPPTYRPGEESEAQICARNFQAAWSNHPGFRDWVRSYSRANA